MEIVNCQIAGVMSSFYHTVLFYLFAVLVEADGQIDTCTYKTPPKKHGNRIVYLLTILSGRREEFHSALPHASLVGFAQMLSCCFGSLQRRIAKHPFQGDSVLLFWKLARLSFTFLKSTFM